jgi:DNA-directed RNA polymerase subunit beta'
MGDTLDDLLTEIGKNDPGQYREVSHKLMDLGGESSFLEGTTVTLSDLTAPSDRIPVFQHVKDQEARIEAGEGTPKEKSKARAVLYGEMKSLLQDEMFESAVKNGNPLAMQVLSGSRGSPAQLQAMLSTPSTFSDAKGETIPVFIQRSYSEGLSPEEYYAATFGARQGVISTKFATRDAGDFGKQLNVASADLVVTENDCGTLGGIPVPLDDKDNVGATLARNVGGFEIGTPITPKMMNALGSKGVKKLLVRSPMTCQAKNGVCKVCVGLREDGKFPAIRDTIGIKASSALAERIAQGSLNVKHQGGQKEKGDEYGGFEIINQLGQVPSTFRYKATLADVDGRVESVEPAPQGGTNITIGGELHYADPGQAVIAQVGDVVEAGDQLSSGIVNPQEVVKHKGLGEGRRYFAERLTKAFRDTKLEVNRRNAEVIARAVVNHVNVTDPEGAGDYLPGDVASYNSLAYSYRPRKDAKVTKAKDAVGNFLEQPALHHTIGSRVTNRMVKELGEFGVDNVMVHQKEPGFEADMIRLRAVPHYGKDWVAKLQGSYLQSNLLKDVHSGATSKLHGTHPVPGVAYGVEFGQQKGKAVTF